MFSVWKVNSRDNQEQLYRRMYPNVRWKKDRNLTEYKKHKDQMNVLLELKNQQQKEQFKQTIKKIIENKNQKSQGIFDVDTIKATTLTSFFWMINNENISRLSDGSTYGCERIELYFLNKENELSSISIAYNVENNGSSTANSHHDWYFIEITNISQGSKQLITSQPIGRIVGKYAQNTEAKSYYGIDQLKSHLDEAIGNNKIYQLIKPIFNDSCQAKITCVADEMKNVEKIVSGISKSQSKVRQVSNNHSKYLPENIVDLNEAYNAGQINKAHNVINKLNDYVIEDNRSSLFTTKNKPLKESVDILLDILLDPKSRESLKTYLINDPDKYKKCKKHWLNKKYLGKIVVNEFPDNFTNALNDFIADVQFSINQISQGDKELFKL